ncbi:threonine/serine exporter [Granulicatella sp. zg-ZJ]|nr:threonine/serine exporter [Granulicatella sp. zg-ZJ]
MCRSCYHCSFYCVRSSRRAYFIRRRELNFMMSLIVAIISSFVAVYAGAIMINAPKKFLIPAGIGGLICWIAYFLLLPITGMLANFYASLLVALYSQLMARVYKTPVTMFFIPGFLPIVPGLAIFRCVYFYISGNAIKFNQYLSETIQIATLIALAIFIIDALFKSNKRIVSLYKKQKK